LNKKKGGRFTKDDEVNVARIAKTLGVAFHNQQQLGPSAAPSSTTCSLRA